MSRPKSLASPKYSHHKASGQAVVYIDRKPVYLGSYGTKASKTAYDVAVAEWLASGRKMPASRMSDHDGMTIIELNARYLAHADQYYRCDGVPTRELEHVKLVLKRLRLMYGRTKAAEFGPLSLKALRERWIEAGYSRKHINTCIDQIKRMFGWAVENELVPPSVYQALKAVKGLMKGRSRAREGRKVLPVPEEFIDAVKERVSDQVVAIIDLQLLTAARPGEICLMRRCDLDKSGKCWTFTPHQHKGKHLDHDRKIHIGPRAQAIIQRFFKTDLSAYLFDPRDAENARSADRRANRKTPMTPTQEKRRRKRNPKRCPGGRYDMDAYRRAIARAMEQAYPPPEHLQRERGEKRSEWMHRLGDERRAELKAWRAAHTWHPHRLRHNAATRLRKEFGIEVARIVCGHHSALVTEIYAEQDKAVASEIMAKVG